MGTFNTRFVVQFVKVLDKFPAGTTKTDILGIKFQTCLFLLFQPVTYHEL